VEESPKLILSRLLLDSRKLAGATLRARLQPTVNRGRESPRCNLGGKTELSMRSQIEEVADRLQSLAAGLRAGTQDPQTVEKKLSSLAEELDNLAQRLKRAARQ
jgi:hypothetical protein